MIQTRRIIFVICIILIFTLTACGEVERWEKIREESRAEEAAATAEAETQDQEEAVVGTELFEQVYVYLATHKESREYSEVIKYLDSYGYDYTTVKPDEDTVGTVSIPGGDDSIFISFCIRDNGTYTIMTMSYLQGSSNKEVLFSNYSTGGEYQYNKYQFHFIGSKNIDVYDVNQQREILFK